MKLIKSKRSIEIFYKEHEHRLKDGLYLLPDEVSLEDGSFWAFSIKKEFYDNLNKPIDDAVKSVLFYIDLNLYHVVSLVGIIKSLKDKGIDVSVLGFNDVRFLEKFGVSVLDKIPSVNNFGSFDRVYVLFDVDSKVFPDIVGIKESKLDIRRKEKDEIVFINSIHNIYKANVSFEDIKPHFMSVNRGILVEEEGISDKSFDKVFEYLKTSKCIITSSPWIARFCDIASIPCLFLVGGFDEKIFPKSHVKMLKNPYVGVLCSAPCGLSKDEKCEESKLKNSAISPCMEFKISSSHIEDTILKYNVKEDVCPYCDNKAHVMDVSNGVIYRECSVCKTIFTDKEIDKPSVSNGFQWYGYMRYESIAHHKDGIYLIEHFHPRFSYIVELLKDISSKNVLVFDTIELGFCFNQNNKVYFYSKSKHIRDLALVSTNFEILDEPKGSFDVIIIPDFSFYKKDILKYLEANTIIISAPNKDKFNRQKYISFEPKNAYFEPYFLKSLIQKEYSYITSSTDYYESFKARELFGDIFTQRFNINNITLPNVFTHNNLPSSLQDTTFGDYLICVYSDSPINSENYIKQKRDLEIKRDIDVFKTHYGVYKEPYLEIYHEGKRGKVLITDHHELVINVSELFSRADFTVGIIKKDMPHINMDRLRKEVLEFNPDFMFSMFFGDLFWMRDESGWDLKTRDFCFRFNFPIVVYKTDVPTIDKYSPTDEGIELLKKYKNKIGIIYQDSFTTTILKEIGIDAYYYPMFSHFHKNNSICYKKPKTIDVVFVGSLHSKNDEFISKHKDSVDCYFNDVEDITKCIKEKPIETGKLNKAFFDKALGVESQIRAIYADEIKKRYNAFYFDGYRLPFTLLCNIISSAKISFYIHSQAFYCIHDMAIYPVEFDTLPIVDRHKEAEILFPEHYKYFTYKNLDEAIKLIDHYLTHEDERMALVNELEQVRQTYYTEENLLDFILYVYERKRSQK